VLRRPVELAAETGQVDFGLPAKPNPQQFHLLLLFLQPQVQPSSNLLRYRHAVAFKQGPQSLQLIVLKPDLRQQAQVMTCDQSMPTLETLLEPIAEARAKYSNHLSATNTTTSN
jgi:hypothetical protein